MLNKLALLSAGVHELPLTRRRGHHEAVWASAEAAKGAARSGASRGGNSMTPSRGWGAEAQPQLAPPEACATPTPTKRGGAEWPRLESAGPSPTASGIGTWPSASADIRPNPSLAKPTPYSRARCPRNLRLGVATDALRTRPAQLFGMQVEVGPRVRATFGRSRRGDFALVCRGCPMLANVARQWPKLGPMLSKWPKLDRIGAWGASSD